MRAQLSALAALHGACGVGFAAIGAHGAAAATGVGTAAMFQLIHAAAALGALALFGSKLAEWGVLTLLAGTLLFALALYLSGLGGVSLGPVAPLGGLTMSAGWLVILWAAVKGPPRP